MIKYFRKIRQNLIMENKSGKYIKYAIGEIVLVVIGILIALSINNWNEKRIEQQTLTNYYERMLGELESSRNNLSDFKEEINNLVDDNRKTLEILNNNNRDSIQVLKTTLGALGTSWTNNFNFPLVKEFINEGYLAKVKNVKIKDGLQAFSIQLTHFNNLDNAIHDQYTYTIEPFINKNLNYSEIALDGYKRDLVSGGPKTNIDNLFNNLEAWNVISLKLELLISQNYRLTAFEAMIERLTNSLKAELENSI